MFKQLESDPGDRVTVLINGERVSLPADQTVAAAALAVGLRHTRTTAVSGQPRAPYCMMGVCYECLMVIDGIPNQRACQQRLREGMTIETQQGTGRAE